MQPKKLNKGKAIKKKKGLFTAKNLKKQPKKAVQQENQEEITSVSSEMSGRNEEDPDLSTHSDPETIDEKRVRLAKKLISEAQNLHQNGIENDEFFLEKPKFQGIYADSDEDDLVTKALQKDLLIKSGMVYTEIADKLREKFTPETLVESSYELKGHTKSITALRIDPVRNSLYSISKDASLIRWDIEKGAKTIISYGKDKDKSGHYDQILALDLSFDGRFLVTVGLDQMIKIWDPISEKVIETLKGHRDSISGVRFQRNSHTFCTVSYDRTFKMWEAAERSYMETFYGHTSQVTCIDSINLNDFVTGGFDKQAIYWKINNASQLLFSGGHSYSVDCVKAVTNETFLTGGQDSKVCLWSVRKKRPIFELANAHNGHWIECFGGEQSSDLFFSGGTDGVVNGYAVGEKRNGFAKILGLKAEGIVNDIAVMRKNEGLLVFVAEGEEQRLGRWVTRRAKNRIKVFNLS